MTGEGRGSTFSNQRERERAKKKIAYFKEIIK